MHQIPFRARTRAMLLLCALALQSGMAARPTGALLAPRATVPGELDALPPAVIEDAPPPQPAPAEPAPAAPAPPPLEPVAPPPPPVETARSLPPAGAATVVVPPSRAGMRPVLEKAARDHGLPTDVILAQAWAESSWRQQAVSYAGAMGVLQLMPDTVDFVSKRLLKLDRTLDPNDPAANARMGARFMVHLLSRTGGDWRQALIAYNQGLTALLRNGAYPAAEAYADRVLALRPQFG
jgi:soluble lytic murein transglycosylase-like protein